MVMLFALPSFGQETAEKPVATHAKRGTWERTKECAAQAEKMMTEWTQRTGSPANDWNNHYSPKYGKCFVKIYLIQVSKDEKVFPTVFQTLLFDAFERSPAIASSCKVTGNSDCAEQIIKTRRDVILDSVSQRLNGKPFSEASAEEQGKARTSAERVLKDAPTETALYCGANGEAKDCTAAANFIAEHMRN